MKVTYSYTDALGMEVTKTFIVEANNTNLQILEDMYIGEQQIISAEEDALRESEEELPF